MHGERYAIYCDESGHLPNDGFSSMSMGAIWCPRSEVREAGQRIREIKGRHGMAADAEVKWTKISPSGVSLYIDLVDYFFDNDSLSFRVLVANDKSKLVHEQFSQTHDDWFYKMYFLLLNNIIQNRACYSIYLDQKDTRSREKVKHLFDVLANANYDFSREIIERVQTVRSDEVPLMQMTDLLLGATSSISRGGSASSAKKEVISRIQYRSHYSLRRSTTLAEQKFNIFYWTPQDRH